jgi:hypothetical protein
MALYRDQVARVSLADVRQSMRPKVWRALSQVTLSHCGVTTTADVIVTPSSTAFSGSRRWFRCPSCGRTAGVLGCVPGVGWRCAACGGWRGRNA